jgi:hypothetical protein
MSEHRQIMALCLAAILLVVVIATAAKPQNLPTAGSQFVERIEPPGPEASPPSRSKMTSRAKAPSQQLPSYEIASRRGHGGVWGEGPNYDLSRTGQASIYIFYTPGSGQ